MLASESQIPAASYEDPENSIIHSALEWKFYIPNLLLSFVLKLNYLGFYAGCILQHNLVLVDQISTQP
jgi:hypothetical protein